MPRSTDAAGRSELWLALALALASLSAGDARADDLAAPHSPARLEITLAGQRLRVWVDKSTRYFLFEGDCFIEQGLYRIRCDECLAWTIETGGREQATQVVLLCRGNVRVDDSGAATQRPAEHRARLQTTSALRIESRQRQNASGADHPLYARMLALAAPYTGGGLDALPVTPHAADALDTGTITEPVQTVQYVPDGANRGGAPGAAPGAAGEARAPQPPALAPLGGNIIPNATGPGLRRVRVFARGSQSFHVDAERLSDGQQIIILTGGIHLVVEELSTGNLVRIMTDRAVLWTKGGFSGEFSAAGAEADAQQPLEVYLEGNVIIRQGNLRSIKKADTKVLEGKQVYFDFNRQQALVLDGAVETFDEQYRVPLFMRAAEIRQLTPQKFYANNAGFTTSPYRGTPGYEFAAGELYFEEFIQRIENPITGAEVIDPDTGQPMERARHFATGYNNVLRVEDFPIFYWPYLRADVDDPLGPLEEIKIGRTDNLGVATTLALDIWQLTGFDYLPSADRSDWLLDFGYYSKRGFAAGSRFNYFGSELFGLSGPHYGNVLTWWIDDEGTDNLGILRQGLVPPRSGRGRFRLQHHQELPHDLTLIAELSYLSDANFLESFYETEYDSGKDQETLIYLKQARGSWGWTALAQPRINGFLPQNPWLPRLDGYLLGLSLLEDRLTYFQHSSVGYGLLRPPGVYVLPADAEVDTGRLDTRHELDLPLQLGPWQVTPFAVGQFTGYTETLSAEGVGRLYAAGGVRTSFPFWRTYPGVESRYFNLHGLAHKVSLDVDYLFARSNRDLSELVFLDQADDDTSELVRRQNVLRRYGGVPPLRWDPRNFLLRSNVSVLPETLDDMHNVRFGVSQRLQTKRGPIGGQRIVDWMYFDAGATYFPEKDRDNFSEELGLIDYHYRWHLGDRTTFTSDMLLEPVDDTLVLQGVLLFQRPPRSQIALFYSHFEAGPSLSDYIGLATSYRFSTKYSGFVATGYDVQTSNNVSYRMGFSRIGLDFVLTTGIVYNAGRRDFGFEFEIVPRAGARTRFNRAVQETLPFGIEPTDNVAPIAADRLRLFTSNFSTN